MDYYTLLQVSRTAGAKEIRRQYFKQALLYHPDRNPATDAHDKFRAINDAYQTLIDPGLRRDYDARWSGGSGSPDSGSDANQDPNRTVMQFPREEDVELLKQAKRDVRATVLRSVSLPPGFEPRDSQPFDFEMLRYRLVEPLLLWLDDIDLENIEPLLVTIARDKTEVECNIA